MLVNEVKLSGRVYRAEVRQTKSGKPITTFGLCFYNGKDAEGKGKYAFINCKAFEAMAIEDKTDVSLNGYLICNEWEDDKGNKRKDFSINVKNVGFVIGKAEEKTEKETNFFDDCPF